MNVQLAAAQERVILTVQHRILNHGFQAVSSLHIRAYYNILLISGLLKNESCFPVIRIFLSQS